MFSGNILILTYWPFKDALIQTYTLPYVKILRKKLFVKNNIWLRTMENTLLSKTEEAEMKDQLAQSGIFWLPSKYRKYGFLSYVNEYIKLVSLIFFCLRNKIKIIHLWCTPPGITGYLISVITGAELIIDSYEPHAEAMVENGTWRKGSFKFKILFLFEKLMSQRASVIISATKGMDQYAKIKYNATFDKFYVKPACVDLKLFDLNKNKNKKLLDELNLHNKTVLLYAGKFGGIYLDKEVFDFVKVAYDYFGEQFSFLLLTSHKRDEIAQFCAHAGIPAHIVISKFVSHSEIPDYMGLADFAITPVKPVPSKRYCTPIKDGEYWALGLPVVITKDISDDSDIIEKEQIGVVLKTLSKEEYHKAIQQIDLILHSDKEQIRQKIRKIAEKYRSFDIAERIYADIYN